MHTWVRYFITLDDWPTDNDVFQGNGVEFCWGKPRETPAANWSFSEVWVKYFASLLNQPLHKEWTWKKCENVHFGIGWKGLTL